MALLRAKLLHIGLVIAVLLGGHAAVAQLPERDYQAADETMRRYATEMSALIPCLYVTGGDEQFVRVFQETEIHQALENLAAYGADEAQRAALAGIFRDIYKPAWAVDDIRTFAAACRPLIQQLNTLRGVGVPLTLRPPFRR